MKKRRNDLLLIAAIFVLISLGNLTLLQEQGEEPGGYVAVTVEGKEYGSYRLDQDRTVEIEGKLGVNTMEIQNGSVRMIHAVCPDLYCVKQKAIHANGEKIICLPGAILLEIIGGTESELDGIVG